MKKKVKSFLIIILTFIAFCIISETKVEAASATLSGNQTVTAGQTVTVTANVNAGAWNLTLSGGGQQKKLVGQTSTAGNASASASITFVANQNTTVTLSGDMTDFTEDRATAVNKSIQITVQAPSQGSNPTPGGSTSSGGNQNTGNSASKPETPSATQVKSSNANLSNLGIRPNDFTGFKKGTTTYNVTVPNNVDSVEVYAKPEDSKSKVSGTGKKSLKEGTNTLSVTVTAENGATKTYKINVTRETTTEENKNETNENLENEATKNETESNEKQEDKKGLASLEIGNVKLTPSFETDIYEYKVKYIGENTELDIKAIATDENYTVDITGNEELKEGENTVTILVSDKEGNNVATYQITVDKSLVDEEAIAREKAEKEKQQKMLIIGAVVAVVVIGIIIFIVVRHKRNKQWAEEYTGIPFADLNDDDLEKNEEPLNNNKKYFEDQYEVEDEEEEDRPRKKSHSKGKRFK